MATIIWLKGMLVAFRFIEIGISHPFIRRVAEAFVAIPLLALMLTAYFGGTPARWATL